MWPILLGLYTILLLLIAQTSTRKKLFNDRLGVYALIFGLIYTGGYCLEHLEGGFRYIWPSYVLLAFTLIRWSGFLNFTHKYKVAIATILVFGLSVYPIATSYRPTVSAIQNSEEIKQLAQQIDAKIDLADYSHVATNSPYSASYLCYYLNLKCYGLPHKENVQGQLLKHHIDYFFEFSGHRHFGVKGIKVFSSNKLTVLEVRPDTSPKR